MVLAKHSTLPFHSETHGRMERHITHNIYITSSEWYPLSDVDLCSVWDHTLPHTYVLFVISFRNKSLHAFCQYPALELLFNYRKALLVDHLYFYIWNAITSIQMELCSLNCGVEVWGSWYFVHQLGRGLQWPCARWSWSPVGHPHHNNNKTSTRYNLTNINLI